MVSTLVSVPTYAPPDPLELAKQFADDMKLGVALHKEVGPWIAHLGSSNSKPESPAYNTAWKTGFLIVSKLGLPVGTGGATGTMEAANKGAWDAKGVSAGIYLEGLPTEQRQNPYCTHSIRCKTLLARQHLLLCNACGVVVGAHGGWGTIFEIGHQLIEMRRKSFNPRCPIVVVDELDQWRGFHEWMEQELVGNGLWNVNEFNKISITHSAEEAIEVLSRFYASLRVQL